MRPVCHGHGAAKSDASQGQDLDQTLAAFVENAVRRFSLCRQTPASTLAWLLPYALGFVGLVDPADRSPLVSSLAVAGGGDTQIDPSLDARLDDELETSTESSFTQGDLPPSGSDSLQPWQLFTLAGARRHHHGVPLARSIAGRCHHLSLAVFAAAAVGIAALRTVMPLTSKARPDGTQVLGGRTRAVLERDKALVLRSIKELDSIARWGRSRRRISPR